MKLFPFHVEKQSYRLLHYFEKVDDQVFHSQLIFEKLVSEWSLVHAKMAEGPKNYELQELLQPLPSYFNKICKK